MTYQHDYSWRSLPGGTKKKYLRNLISLQKITFFPSERMNGKFHFLVPIPGEGICLFLEQNQSADWKRGFFFLYGTLQKL